MIKVVIERHCRPNMEAEMERLLIGIRTEAMQQRGYITGETLRSIDNPSLWLIISTWANIDMWKAWETSPERRQEIDKMKPLLAAPEKIAVYSFARRGITESAHTIDK